MKMKVNEFAVAFAVAVAVAVAMPLPTFLPPLSPLEL